MRAKKWRGRTWAARLGLFALALNALVPVHLAFDIAEALGPAQQCGAHVEVGGAERRLLALLSGHPGADGKYHQHGKHHACPVCSALGALSSFAPPAPTALLVPVSAGLPVAPFIIRAERVGIPAAYHSRAPPLA